MTDVGELLRISAANGKELPFIGYIELSLVAFGTTFPKMGFLVVKDPVDETIRLRKTD